MGQLKRKARTRIKKKNLSKRNIPKENKMKLGKSPKIRLFSL
jgi:hypothetical protein